MAGVHWSHVTRDSISHIATGVADGRTSVTTGPIPPRDGVASRVPVPLLCHTRMVDPVTRDWRHCVAVDCGWTGECCQFEQVSDRPSTRVKRSESHEFRSVNPWRLALSRRWLGILGTTVLFAIACVGLGQWQFARRAEAQAAIALLNANYERPVVDLAAEVPNVTDAEPGDKWKTVRVTGTYLADSVTYVRTRSGPGGIGFEQLAALTQSDGTVFIVDRGWVPSNADNSAPATTPALPAGTVIVTSHLIPGEQLISGRDAPAGQIATINLDALDTAIDGKVYRGWYGRLASESPSTHAGAPWERPVLDEGPHLSYALQWYVFALMGFIGYGWALRKEARGDVIPEPKVRRHRSDEDIEDAAVDATRAR